MPYSIAQITQIKEAFDEWEDKSEYLVDFLLRREHRTDRSKEFAVHGFLRRVSALRHAIHRVFELVPLDSVLVEKSDLDDATLFLHAFVVNTHGALDNLSHYWVLERRILDADGKELPSTKVGLFSHNKEVRRSLMDAGIVNFDEFDEWLAYFRSYRHALAHRIPLYIAPRVLDPESVNEYRAIDLQLASAMQNRNFAEWDRLIQIQSGLGRFEPLMMHSFEEGVMPMRFHAQMVCDFATVIEWGQKIADRL